MFSKLSRKKSKTPPVAKADDISPAMSDEGHEDAYAEQPMEGASVRSHEPTINAPSDKSAGAESETPAANHPATTRKKVSLGKSENAETATAADMVNPRALIAEAIGSHAVTLAKTNTILKVSTLSLSALALVLGITTAIGFSQDVQYRYFFEGSDGSVTERTPLATPVLSLNRVRDFYAQSISNLFSFHYRNFADHYQRLAPNIMTEVAMREFAQELDRIGLISSMKERREVAEAVILQTPVLSASGEDPKTGRYTWELSVPFNLRLEAGRGGDNSVRRMGGVARVQIIRVEPTVHPRQILINRITIRDTTNE